MLQNDHRVAVLQQRLWHRVLMSRRAKEPGGKSVGAWVGLVVLVAGAASLAAGCGGGSSGQRVATLGTATSTTTPSAAASSGKTSASPTSTALAFSQCMRTHGEPSFPEPVFEGKSAHVTIHAGSGVDPNSPQFTAANNKCKHLLPNNGAPSPGQTISPAEQTDYIKAAACMRSHGVPDFPDPTFGSGSVSFATRTPIDTNTPQYQSALTTCRKLIPAGLPYSSSAGP